MATVLLAGLLNPFFHAFGQESQTAHYKIYADDPARAERLAVDMEGRFAVYNRLFRFNPESLTGPLTVRLLADTAAYDAYVQDKLGEKRPGAVYLHYAQAARRELVIDETRNRAFPYHAFIQYLRAFIPNPPFWMQEGFAIYFTTLEISPTGELIYEENLSWLDQVKKGSPPPLEAIFLADAAAEALVTIPPADRSAYSWSLVSFFLNSGNEDYFRTLLESFLLLSPAKTAAENSLVLAEQFQRWNGFENLNRDYAVYLSSRKTFNELMDEGRAAYGAGDNLNAEEAFVGAINLRPNHYAPYYYLGLIAYGEGVWLAAEQYYNRSLELGADTALVYYALATNAASAGKREAAAALLRSAADADPARYREKADDLLRRMANQ
jgi:tetratricopeptide (TPR) repeat protein